MVEGNKHTHTHTHTDQYKESLIQPYSDVFKRIGKLEHPKAKFYINNPVPPVSAPLKVVSATFLLVCFLSLKESTCETKKTFFTSKALFALEKNKF